MTTTVANFLSTLRTLPLWLLGGLALAGYSTAGRRNPTRSGAIGRKNFSSRCYGKATAILART